MIMGESGSGKSTSIRNLDSKKTFVINVCGKPLPFKGWKSNYIPMTKDSGNMVITDSSERIIKALEYVNKSRTEVNAVIIDDFQYVMANEFMRRSSEKGFEKFTEIGRHAWDIINFARSLRDDLVVFITIHIDENDNGKQKPKTIGKLLDDKICLEGMFSIVLKAVCSDGQYKFITQSTGNDVSKSPMGMFPLEIENDMQIVIDSIKKYEE